MNTVSIEPQRAGFGAWWMVGVLLLLYVLSFMDRFILTMLVDPIKADLQISDVQMGLLIGPAFSISYAIFGLPFGWASDRFSRKWVIWSGVTLWSAATALCSLAGTFGHLLTARLGVGISEASISPAAYSLLGDRMPRDRLTTALSIYQMAPKIGIAMSFALGGLVMTLASNFPVTGLPVIDTMKPWQLTFLLIGVPSLLLGLLALTIAEPVRRGRAVDAAGLPVARAKIVPYLRANRRLVTLMLLGFGFVGALGPAINQWVPAFMSRTYHWTPIETGSALGIASTIAACFLPISGVIVDRLYKRGMKDAHIRFYTWLLAPLIPITAIAFTAHNPIVFLVCYTIIQAVALPFMLYLSSTIQLIVPNELRGQIVGLFMMIISTCFGSLGPVVVGALTDYVFGDPAKLGWSLAVVAPIGCALSLIFLRFALQAIKPAVETLSPVVGERELVAA